MLDLGYLESALLLLSAALFTALCVLVWWKAVGGRVKELISEWRGLPIFWRIILPVVFGAFCLHGSTKNGNVANVQVLPVVKSNYQSGNGENPSNLVNPVNPVQNTPTVFDEEIALGYRLDSVRTNTTYSYACFQVEFPQLMPPAEDIKWSVVEGSAEFMGADFGSKVYVKANTANEIVKLRVRVGDCVSRPIEFTAFAVEPLSVKTTVWIVRDDRGRYAARTPIEVTNMMNEVNRIYEQIGVSFYIDSISFTNRSEWLDLRIEPGHNDKCNYRVRRELVNVTKDSAGIELYFIDYVAKDALANANMFGIVLSTNATTSMLAHELGHAFGCSDIYHAKKNNGQVITLPDKKASKEHAQYDWNNGSGCRYYHSGITQDNVIASLLMCGYSYSKTGDMSFGSIYGFARKDNLAGLVDVGFFRGCVRKLIQYHK